MTDAHHGSRILARRDTDAAQKNERPVPSPGGALEVSFEDAGLGLRIRGALLPRRYDLFAELGAGCGELASRIAQGAAKCHHAAVIAAAAVLVVQTLRREISVRTDAGGAAGEAGNGRELVRLTLSDGAARVRGRYP